MTQEPSSSSVYTRHLINQIHSNLDLLLQQSVITSDTLHLIKNTLPNPSSDPQPKSNAPPRPIPSPNPPQNSQSVYPQPPPQPFPAPHHAPPPPLQLQQPQQTLKQAKALWAYHGSASDDLSFEKGDIIVILAEENEDWWKGQVLNSQAQPGLFPSNHVEIISPTNPADHSGPNYPPPPQPYPPPSAPLHYRQDHPPAPYPPPPQHQHQSGPPTWQSPAYGQQQPHYYADNKSQLPQVAHYHPPPPPLEHTQSAPPAQITVEKPKKKPLQGRFGQALVGGAGFGAGSAVASHVVNAIL